MIFDTKCVVLHIYSESFHPRTARKDIVHHVLRFFPAGPHKSVCALFEKGVLLNTSKMFPTQNLNKTHLIRTREGEYGRVHNSNSPRNTFSVYKTMNCWVEMVNYEIILQSIWFDKRTNEHNINYCWFSCLKYHKYDYNTDFMLVKLKSCREGRKSSSGAFFPL